MRSDGAGALEQARRLFLAGVDHFEARRLDDAEASFEASLALAPGRASVLVNLAATRIALHRPEAALPLLDAALAGEPDGIDAWMHRGKALFDLGRHDEALACHDKVRALAPDHAPNNYHRAITLAVLGRHAGALAAFEHLLQLTPDNAEAWFRRAQTLQYLERHGEALASYERALALDAGIADAWTNRGNILKELDCTDEAAASFRNALASGGDTALNGYYLAAVSGEQTPGAPPLAYVERLFDDYAASFDEHALGTLGYRAHRVLIEGVRGLAAARFGSALDLGCGTGLCAPLLAAVADRVDGVDVSSCMLAKARTLGLYDRLTHAELAAHLEQTDRRHDLVVAADVFIYLGALEAVFRGVRRVLDARGMFCFTVERADEGTDFELRKSLRYAHSERYLRALAARAGFEVVRIEQQPIREDQRRPVEGLYAYLRAA